MPIKYRQLDSHASASKKSGKKTSTYPPKKGSKRGSKKTY